MAEAVTLQLPPAARQTLGESVAATLRQAIFSGHIKPGNRIAQAQVAGELGVSQAPVRDALAVLEREGLVERSSNSGAVVTTLSADDIEEICSLRVALEALALSLAIRKITAADLVNLEDNIRTTEKARTPADAAALDLQFHELLIRLANHRRLLSCWQTLQAQLKLGLVQQGMTNPDFPRQVASEHRKLLEQIQAKNERHALALLEDQLEKFHRCALKLIVKGAS